ncbi:helix-turn-helix domain-containing protein, partial [Nocardiopsis sediminis]
AGLTTPQVVQELGWAAGKLSKIENSETQTVKSVDLDRMLDLYEVSDPAVREAMQRLARDAKERGWWAKYREVFGAQALPDFEAEASVIRCFEGLVVPGLLQTPEYAHALFQGGRYAGPKDIARRVEARMARRNILTKFNPAQLNVVMDEAALRRMIGGPAVMKDQMAHLLYMAQLPNIEIRLLPFAIGSHAALVAPFSILEFTADSAQSIVHVDTVTDSAFFEEPGDVERYSATFDDIQAIALNVAPSMDFIQDVAADFRE